MFTREHAGSRRIVVLSLRLGWHCGEEEGS
jgi:hypothetical protein